MNEEYMENQDNEPEPDNLKEEEEDTKETSASEDDADDDIDE